MVARNSFPHKPAVPPQVSTVAVHGGNTCQASRRRKSGWHPPALAFLGTCSQCALSDAGSQALSTALDETEEVSPAACLTDFQ